MWPWEHVAFAYVLYSILTRGSRGHPPSDRSVYPLAFGALFPDLVDKPLAWTYGVFSSGYAVGHSLFTVPVLALAVVVVAYPLNRQAEAAAFLLGHVAHLLGDIVYPALTGGPLAFSAVLWPLVPSPATPVHSGLLSTFLEYFTSWSRLIGNPEASTLLLFEVTLVVAVVGLWIFDGTPGIPNRRTAKD
jgi:hypothetical protein